jgi:hypothetical protein
MTKRDPSYYTARLQRAGWIQLWARGFDAALAQLQERAARTGDTISHPPQWHR